jgi:transmembrane sensor
MTGHNAMIDEQALDWVIRTRDSDFADWGGFTAWLEAAPEHAAAYDRLASADADLPEMLPPERGLPVPANDAGAPLWKRWRWAGAGVIAAALVGIVSLSTLQSADPYSVSTGAGERREIALQDGTKIALNGNSTLRLDHANPRFAALDKGEAIFTVTHDEKDPFRVTVGGVVLEDAGTVFNVTRDGGVMRVGVAEGSVIYNPESEAIALPAGASLRMTEGRKAVVVGQIAPEAVTGWQAGRLTYSNVSLTEVAGDLSRNLGVAVRVDTKAAASRFTGTILLDRDPAQLLKGTAPLLGVEAMRQDGGWLLKGTDATRD